LAVRTDGLNVRLYLRGDVGAVVWTLDIVDVRRVVMLMEFLRGLRAWRLSGAFAIRSIWWPMNRRGSGRNEAHLFEPSVWRADGES